MKFVPSNLNIDEERNFENFDIIQHSLREENKYFLNKVNYLKDLLDKMTDLCGNDEFLSKNTLNELLKYLDTYYEYIVANIAKFYKDNRISYMNNIYLFP